MSQCFKTLIGVNFFFVYSLNLEEFWSKSALEVLHKDDRNRLKWPSLLELIHSQFNCSLKEVVPAWTIRFTLYGFKDKSIASSVACNTLHGCHAEVWRPTRGVSPHQFSAKFRLKSQFWWFSKVSPVLKGCTSAEPWLCSSSFLYNI